MAQVTSFPPIADRSARILILGSMPGEASLAAGQYYAHPRNAFWSIMASLCGFPVSAGYRARCRALRAAGIALWDVLQQCERTGSLDAAIDPATVVANDFPALFRRCPRIERIFFNGGTAEKHYLKHVVPALDQRRARLPALRLPSTSPAHAAMSLAAKQDAWRVVCD